MGRFLYVLVVIGLCGCGRQATPTPGAAAPGPPLTLFCGAGIRSAAEALVAEFQKREGAKVTVTYAGSGVLLGQISALQQGDLFMPGAELYVDTALAKGLAWPETKRVIAYFIPVILVAKGNPKGVHALADLTKPGLRVGLGDERACAVGQTAQQIFAKNRLTAEALAPNVVYRSGTVEELGVALRLGTVDAVIVWDVTARAFAEAGELVPIPDAQNVISPIPVVVLKSSAQPAVAKRFVDLVSSADGQRILRNAGWTVALEPKVEPRTVERP